MLNLCFVPAGTLQLTPKGLKPGFDISFGNQLAKNTVGYLSYSTNWRLDETDDVSKSFWRIVATV